MNPQPQLADTPIPDTTDAVRLLDHAASQSDRWLFLALLVAGIVFVYFLIRYFMKWLAAMFERIDQVRTTHENYVKDAGAKMVECIAKNTVATEQNTRLLEAVQRKLGG